MDIPVNLHFERTGGFAGLRLSHDIGSADLTPEENNEFSRLIDASHFFDLPAEIRAANPGADRFQYKLTLNTGPRQHTVALDDAAVPETMRPLINWVTAKVRTR